MFCFYFLAFSFSKWIFLVMGFSFGVLGLGIVILICRVGMVHVFIITKYFFLKQVQFNCLSNRAKGHFGRLFINVK